MTLRELTDVIDNRADIEVLGVYADKVAETLYEGCVSELPPKYYSKEVLRIEIVNGCFFVCVWHK